jgi:hypothetical protein
MRAFEVISKVNRRVMIVRRTEEEARKTAEALNQTGVEHYIRETFYKGTGDGYFDVTREYPLDPKEAKLRVLAEVKKLGELAAICGPYSGHYDPARYDEQQDRVAEAKRKLRVSKGIYA